MLPALLLLTLHRLQLGVLLVIDIRSQQLFDEYAIFVCSLLMRRRMHVKSAVNVDWLALQSACPGVCAVVCSVVWCSLGMLEFQISSSAAAAFFPSFLHSVFFLFLCFLFFHCFYARLCLR